MGGEVSERKGRLGLELHLVGFCFGSPGRLGEYDSDVSNGGDLQKPLAYLALIGIS